MDIVYLMPWILNIHYIVYIYSLYMLTYSQNTFQLKKWFSYHKFMYFGPCATSIGCKRVIKHSIESYWQWEPNAKKPLVNRSIIAWDIPWFVLKISKLMHSDYSHNYTLYMKCCWGYDLNTVFFISQARMLQFTRGFLRWVPIVNGFLPNVLSFFYNKYSLHKVRNTWIYDN